MPVTVLKDSMQRLNKINLAIDALTKQAVYVGVPASTTDRNDTPITNAALAYIHNFGSPARNIPQREFLEPGIKNNKSFIVNRMTQTATNIFKARNPVEFVQQNLHAIGLTTADSIRQKITDGPFVPLAPLTIAARKKKIGKGKVNAPGFVNIRPLVDTGQLRRSITYVIRDA